MSFVDRKMLLWSVATMWMFASQSIVGGVVIKGSTCGPPTPPYGSSIIHPPEQENYNDGSVVLFGCEQGFYLVGPPIVTCSGNTWTEIKFRCLGFCPEFRYIMNGQVIHVSPKVGKAAVEFHCNKNYRLIGRTRLECINGRWNGKLPFCEMLKSCVRLQAPTNGTLLGNDTTHGAKASFACLRGFDLFGSPTLTCNNGLWNGSVPSCKAFCMKIRDPSNGRKFGTRFSHGNVVSFECKPGYKLVGNRALKCINGKWNSTVPVCNVMLCPKPSIPNNSYIIYPATNQDNYVHGTKLFLACRGGHYLTGSPIMECNQTVWLKMEFSCIASCPVLGPMKNGIITHVTLKDGGEVEIKCRTNYTLVGSPKLVCTNGKWNDSLPSCGAPCSVPATPSNGWKRYQELKHGHSVKFFCSAGYDRLGASSITCNDGTWDNQVPLCKARCSDPGSPIHGRKRGEIFRHNSWVQFLCYANYQLDGDQWIQCVDGSWSGTVPKCIATCPDPGVPYQGNRIGQDFRHDHTITFICPKDYVMEGVSTIKCSDGKWSNNKPSCKAPCQEPVTPAHGWKRDRDFRHERSVRFYCFRGYQRIGAASIACNDGKWDNRVPVCKGICRRPRDPSHGGVHGNSFLDGEEVTFSCDRNYDLFGNSKLRCVDRRWDSSLPECKARCRFPGRPVHGFYKKGMRKVGDMIKHSVQITFGCFRGYTLVGAKMQECSNGRWINDRPECKELCQDPGRPQNGWALGNNYDHGSVVRFVCKNRTYDLIGASIITCKDGKWSDPTPSCEAKCNDPGKPDKGTKVGVDYRSRANVTFRCKPPFGLLGRHVITCKNGKWSDSTPTCSNCARPLGMENSNIRDFRITSPYSYPGHPSSHARLNGPSSWCTTRQTYLQIDLSRPYKLTAIATQGGTRLNKRVKRYTIRFYAGATLLVYSESGSQKTIIRNKDASSIVKYHFQEPFVTKRVRIYPDVDTSPVCLRMELYGCDPTPDCILVGSEVWGFWAFSYNSLNYYRATIIKLNATHVDFALQVNNRQTRSYKRSDPVLVIDKIPEMKDISVNSRVIAVHRTDMKEWYRTGTVTDTDGSSFVSVKFHDGHQRHRIPLKELRLANRPRVCADRV